MPYSRLTDDECAALTTAGPDGTPVGCIAPDEAVLRLDTGETVAVSLTALREPATQGRVMTVVARWLDDEGGTRQDLNGARVAVSFRHLASAAQLATHGEPAIRRALLQMVLGEPDPDAAVAWPAAVRASANIRQAISAATGEGPDWGVAGLL